MASVCDKLKLKKSATSLGRYWIANETIKCGELLLRESSLASVPNTQIKDLSLSDPISSSIYSQCWNCLCLFRRTDPSPYCSEQCRDRCSSEMDIILNPTNSFTKIIANDCTLRLTVFMVLRMIHYVTTNHREAWLSNIDDTFAFFEITPSAFYAVFLPQTDGNPNTNNNNRNNGHHGADAQCDDELLQCSFDGVPSFKTYQVYIKALNRIVPELLTHFNLPFLTNSNLNALSVRLLNMVFVNGFGIRYSVQHDDDMLGMALFHRASYFNHSCSPNAFYYFENGQIHIRSLRDIQRHEAVTIAIVQDLESQPIRLRQEMILNHFGFKCLCDRCNDREYVESDCLLKQRRFDPDCVVIDGNNHHKCLNFARSNWRTNHKVAWKFYELMFKQYQYHYHPFDPDVLSILQEISQRAYTVKAYQIGYDAAELGKEFAKRLTACGVLDNCHLKEFRFMFLSFCHYVHLVKDKIPSQQMEQILNMKLKDIGDDVGVEMETEMEIEMESNVDPLDDAKSEVTAADDDGDVHGDGDKENVDVDLRENDETAEVSKSQDAVDEIKEMDSNPIIQKQEEEEETMEEDEKRDDETDAKEKTEIVEVKANGKVIDDSADDSKDHEINSQVDDVVVTEEEPVQNGTEDVVKESDDDSKEKVLTDDDDHDSKTTPDSKKVQSASKDGILIQPKVAEHSDVKSKKTTSLIKAESSATKPRSTQQQQLDPMAFDPLGWAYGPNSTGSTTMSKSRLKDILFADPSNGKSGSSASSILSSSSLSGPSQSTKSSPSRKQQKQKQKQKQKAKKKKSKGKQRKKKKGYVHAKKKGKKSHGGNVRVYSFDADGDKIEGETARPEEEEEEESLEETLNDKLIELCAARAMLFPEFKDFEQWIGKDMEKLDPTMWTVVDALKGQFEQIKL